MLFGGTECNRRTESAELDATPSPTEFRSPIRFILQRLAVLLTLFSQRHVSSETLFGNVAAHFRPLPISGRRDSDHSLGLRSPYLVQYWDWTSDFVQRHGNVYVFAAGRPFVLMRSAIR